MRNDPSVLDAPTPAPAPARPAAHRPTHPGARHAALPTSFLPPLPTLAGALLLAGFLLWPPATGEAQARGGGEDPTCAALLEGANRGDPLDQFTARLRDRAPDAATLRRCAPVIRDHPLVQDITQGEIQRVQSRFPELAAGAMRSGTLSLPASARGETVESARRVGTDRRAQVERALATRAQESAPLPDLPAAQLTSVTPELLSPGTDLVLEGAGFGEGTDGTLTLTLHGTELSLSVVHWADDVIVAELSRHIVGVLPGMARARVTPAGGGLPGEVDVAFEPSMVPGLAIEPVLVWTDEGPTNVVVFANQALQNGWSVALGLPLLYGVPEPSPCTLQPQAPPMAAEGEASLASRIRIEATDDTSLAYICIVFLAVRGPVGMDPGAPSVSLAYQP